MVEPTPFGVRTHESAFLELEQSVNRNLRVPVEDERIFGRASGLHFTEQIWRVRGERGEISQGKFGKGIASLRS